MATETQADVSVRPATPDDIAACGRICFDAFSSISQAHGFPPDLPHPDVASGLLGTMFTLPEYFYAVVAEHNGRIVGSNVLDERAAIRGVGPITVDPAAQNLGVGRKLMQTVLDRAAEHHAPGVRLVQAAFHNRSLSLYTNLGFDVRELLSCMQGTPRERTIPGCSVRPACPEDLPACNALPFASTASIAASNFRKRSSKAPRWSWNGLAESPAIPRISRFSVTPPPKLISTSRP
jgi:predicted N-acetyltransferase YhbS